MQGSELSPVNGNLGIPSGEIIPKEREIPMTILVPRDVWRIIFNHLGCGQLRSFTDYKVRIMGQPLTGAEDTGRLLNGEKFIFEKKSFLEVVKKVYSLARCCQNFYVYTERERKLLLKAAMCGKVNRQYFIDVPWQMPQVSVAPPPPRDPFERLEPLPKFPNLEEDAHIRLRQIVDSQMGLNERLFERAPRLNFDGIVRLNDNFQNQMDEMKNQVSISLAKLMVVPTEIVIEELIMRKDEESSDSDKESNCVMQ